jgi:hypothetical protein
VLDWLEIAYLTSTLIMIIYCFRSYFLFKKNSFRLFGLGFTFLLISSFLWMFTIIPGLNEVTAVFSYIRLGLYTAFVLLTLRAMQLLNPDSKAKTQ